MLGHVSVRGVAVGLFATALLVETAARPAFAQDDQPAAGATQQPPAAVAPQRPVGLLADPAILARAIDFATERFGDGTGEPTNGFYPEFSNMNTGSGWISVGPGYRHYFSNDRVFVDGSAALSWHLYTMAQARLEFQKLANDHLVVGTQTMFQDQTQVNFFGIGPNVNEDDQSQYRMQTHDVVAYAKATTVDWLSFTGEFGWLGRPNLKTPSGTFRGDSPATQVAFPTAPGVSLAEQPSFLHSEAAVMADTRDYRSHPTSGSMYRAAVTSFSDQSTGTFSFRQYEAEGLQIVPIVGKTWIFALRGWSLYSAVPLGHEIPFYLLPALGGNNTLRDYHTFQFHDDNLLLVNAESRVAMLPHVDLAVFFDAGNVASRYSDLNLAKTSYGAGLRLHTDNMTFGRIDVAYGAQGWNFVLRTSEPLRLSRTRRQVASVPFMP
jgi:Omp85 superfamily domain